MKKLMTIIMMVTMIGLTGCSATSDELLALDSSKIVQDSDGNMIILEDVESGKIVKVSKEDLDSFMNKDQ